MDSLTLRKLELQYNGDSTIFSRMVRYKTDLQNQLVFNLDVSDKYKLQHSIRNESLIPKLLSLVFDYQKELDYNTDTFYMLTKSASVILSELDMPEYKNHNGHLNFYNAYIEYQEDTRKNSLEEFDIKNKLILFDLGPRINSKIRAIDFQQIEKFTAEKIRILFINFNKDYVQRYVNDFILDETITNYLTHIIEVGSVKSFLFNQLGNLTNEEFDDYTVLLAWAYNISVAVELKKAGMTNIPAIENGKIEIYFASDAIEKISIRIMHHISLTQMHNKVYQEMYLNGLLTENFKI